MAKNYKIYLGGKFVETENKFSIHNPFNNEVIATSYIAGVLELEAAIEKGLQAEKAMKNLPSHKKYKILMQIVAELRANKQYLAEILSQEAAKPLRYALGEIERATQTFSIAAEEAKRLPKEYVSLDWTPAGQGKEGIIKHFPIGLIAGIAPFNFPLNLAVHKIAPAIASGNPIILKPSRSTPLSTLELAKIIDKTDLPKGAISIIPTNRQSGNMLVTDDRFKLLSFTGSPAVGWKMKSEAGRKKVLLELGGNAGMYVSDNCDLGYAVSRSLIGAFAYSGQVCIHAQRIYVHEAIFEKYLQKFNEATSKLKFGLPTDPETKIYSMIDEQNAMRVEAWVNEAVADGAKIVYGGKRNGTYFEPTILTNTQNEMKVCSLEVFGPVVNVEKVKSVEDAVEQINNSQFGLQAGIFSDSFSEAKYAFENLEVGGVIINDIPTFRVDNMPYGGIKNSGFGREGVKYSIHEMTEPKLMVF